MDLGLLETPDGTKSLLKDTSAAAKIFLQELIQTGALR